MRVAENHELRRAFVSMQIQTFEVVKISKVSWFYNLPNRINRKKLRSDKGKAAYFLFLSQRGI
ncbi:MAG: hypothetical protein LBH82_02090 [Bacteroidales bacterium]|nr:hypothetical protein [Bacteroidales bacterium]